MKHLRLAPIILLSATLVLALMPPVLQAKEETLVILSTNDTRSELAPCG
ncbi:MAG: hypothetical protein NTX17_09650 [Candidatus Eisenbacteria bacterium]|nr:hypothetical protein [Candidatus Eisenbacteria bacterium]